VQEILAGFDPAALEAPLFLELLACTGGCVNGPGMSGAAPGLTRHIYPRNYACSADNSLDKAMLSRSPPIDADYPLAPVTDTAHTDQEITKNAFLSLAGTVRS
jgi:hypothetical protein